MKKALVILLSLLVVGGVFAQTVTWTGTFDAAIAMVNRGADDDPTFGVHAPSNGAGAARFDLTFAFTNADGNAGATVHWRSTAAGPQDVTSMGLRQAFGWVRLFDNMLEVRAGRIHSEPHLNNRDGFTGGNFTSGPTGAGRAWGAGVTGVNAYLFPMDGLVLGFGAWANQSYHPGATWDAGGASLYGGFAYTMPGLLRVNAAVMTNHLVTDAHAGLQIFGAIPVNTGFRFLNLHEFGDEGEISGIVGVPLNNLVDDVQLGFMGTFGHSQDDDADFAWGAGAWVAYTALGNIVPRLDVLLMSGFNFNWGWGGFQNTFAWTDHPLINYDNDTMFLHFRPAVQIRATSAAWLELGAIINIDLGDVATAGGAGDGDDTLTFGIFAGVRVGF